MHSSRQAIGQFCVQLRSYSAIRNLQLPITHQKHAKYGGRYTATALPGDGIGPEMLQHVRKIFRFAHVPIDLEILDLNSKDMGTEALENAITSIKRNGVAIKGNIETKFDDPDFTSRNVALRRDLDLYANILHCITIPTIPSRHKDIDIVLIRENTEGEYSGMEHQTVDGVIESLKIVTRKSIERIARFAFEYALLNNRNKITAIHKANIQKLGDGLFLTVCNDMAKLKRYKDIKFDAMIVDNASMQVLPENVYVNDSRQLVSRPQQFSGGVLLMPNLYGNIISNIACGLVGGPGLVSGINVGDKYAVFETGTRNTGTSIAGQDIANPTAFIRAGIDLCNFLELYDSANQLSAALYKTLTQQKIHTRDIGGQNKASELVESMLQNIKDAI